MRRVKTLGDAGRLAEADALLDEILVWFTNQAGAADSLFGDNRVVRIRGYEGDAMGPFVSRDGRHLFFNSAGGGESGDAGDRRRHRRHCASADAR
ncbi:MAG: hypothetical protein ACE5ED_08570 [Rhodothalassiaceae bacterium]